MQLGDRLDPAQREEGIKAMLEQGVRADVYAAASPKYPEQLQGESVRILYVHVANACVMVGLPVVTSRIRGVSPSPSGILYNFNEWYVPKTQQRYTSG